MSEYSPNIPNNPYSNSQSPSNMIPSESTTWTLFIFNILFIDFISFDFDFILVFLIMYWNNNIRV